MKKIKTLSILLMALALCFSFLSISTYAAQVRLNYSEVSVFVGKSKTLKVKGTSKKATWKSSNKKVATVSKTGKVTGKKAGTAVITATVDGNSYKCSVTVKNPQLNATSMTMAIGDTFKLKVTGAKAKSFRFSNEKVATVSSKGVITAKKSGTAVITVQTDTKKLKCKIKVKKYVLNHSELVLYKNTVLNITDINAPYTFIDNVVSDRMLVSLCVNGNYGKKKVKWSSADKKVATVDKNGMVTVQGVGQTTITAKIGNQKLKCKVKVNDLQFHFFRTYSDPQSEVKTGWLLNSSYSLIKNDIVKYKITEREYRNGHVIKEKDVTKDLKLTPSEKGHFSVNPAQGTIKALSKKTSQLDGTANLTVALGKYDIYTDGSNQNTKLSGQTTGQRLHIQIFNHERHKPSEALRIDLNNETCWFDVGETMSLKLHSYPMTCTFSADGIPTFYADWGYLSTIDKFTWESSDESIFKVSQVYGNGEKHLSRAELYAVSPGEAVLTAKYNGEIADTIKIRVYPAD